MKPIIPLSSQHSPSGRRFFLLTILVVCLIMSLASFKIVRNWEEERLRFEFERLSRNQTSRIVESFQDYQTAVHSVGDFLKNTVDTTRKEFRGFAENILATYPGMQAVSWNVRIRDNQRAVYEKAGQNEGFENFQFTERDAAGEMVRAAPRPEYVVVYYIEPLEGNLAALGFDIASSAKRLKTIQQARDTGKIAITEKIVLVQEKNKTGILILFPIYKTGVALSSPAERRTYLEGFSVGVLCIEHVVQNTLFEESRDWMDVYLYDESAEKGKQLLYYSAAGEATAPMAKDRLEANFHWPARFEVGGRQWKIVMVPSAAYKRAHQSRQAWLLLTFMLLFSFLLLLYLKNSFVYTRNLEREISERKQAELELQQYRTHLEELVQKRTEELSEVNKDLELKIIERKQAGVLLRKSEARIRAVVDNLVDGIITADKMGGMESFNSAAESIFGYRADEVIGQNIKMLMPDPYHSKHDAYLAEYMNSGQAKNIGVGGREVSGRRKDGSIFPMEISVNVMEIDEQLIFIAIIRDITARKKAEEELQRSKEAAETANRAKSEFLASMSHEFRTPLTGILGLAQSIKRAKSRGKLKEETLDKCLVDVIESARHLTGIIDDILDISKIEAGQLQFTFEPVDLRQMIGTVFDGLQSRAREKKLDLAITVPEGFPLIRADKKRLRQIFFNLVDNAIKFVEHGFVRVECEVMGAGGTDVQIRVTDSGCGISADHLPFIFDRFMRVENSGFVPGSGLGLTITKRLVELHGWQIGVESEVGRGTTFTINIPVAGTAEPG